MSSTSESITWQRWSQKWGDWTTWFPKMDVQRDPLHRGLVPPGARVEGRTENVRKGTSKQAVAH
jgi:hypothetical protein